VRMTGLMVEIEGESNGGNPGGLGAGRGVIKVGVRGGSEETAESLCWDRKIQLLVDVTVFMNSIIYDSAPFKLGMSENSIFPSNFPIYSPSLSANLEKFNFPCLFVVAIATT